MEKWEKELLEEAQKIMVLGGKLELVVYKRDNKRKPVIHIYPDNERNLDEVVLVG